MIDPMAVILAPPMLVFGWVVYDLRRQARRAAESAEAQAPRPVPAPTFVASADAGAPAPVGILLSQEAA